jgi:hypothetical protein
LAEELQGLQGTVRGRKRMQDEVVQVSKILVDPNFRKKRSCKTRLRVARQLALPLDEK